MRKADYATLAHLLYIEIVGTEDEELRAAFVQLARDFAARAHVDKAEFLKACGIK